MLKRVISVFFAAIMLTGLLFVAVNGTSATHPFTDVPGWADEYVSTVYEKEIMKGTGGTTFGSDLPLTREQLVVTLYRIAKSTVTGSLDTLSATFADADDISSWAVDAVAWAIDEGITSGIPKGDLLYFKPEISVSRQETAKFLDTFIDYMGLTVPTDMGVQINDIDKVAVWAREGVDRCVAAGIISGDGKGNFEPTRGTTRVEAARMLACLPEADNGIIFPNYNRPSQDKNDPNPSNIGTVSTDSLTLVEDFKVSQAVVMDDGGAENQFTVTGISTHGWHETRVVRNEYGTYIVFVQDESLLETGTYKGDNTYAIAEAKFMLVQVTDHGFNKVYESTFPIWGNCSPNLLCGNDGMVYIVNILVDPVSYFHSDLAEYSAYLAVHEFDTKTNTIKHVGKAVVPFENPDPDAFQIVGVMNADKQHPVIDNINNTIHACFGAGGNFGVGYVSWFNYDISTHTWENKNYNGEIPTGANRFEYFNLFADGKGGIFGVGCRTGTPEQLTTLYKKLYDADIKFNTSSYVWDAVYLFAIPDINKEEVVILDKIYEPDYTNERKFPRTDGMITPAHACTYDGGCTFLASDGYFHVFYSVSGANYYSVYDANNGFEKIRGPKKLTLKNTNSGSSHYQLAVGENTDGEVYLVALDQSLSNAQLELYKINLEETNLLIPMIRTENGSVGAIPMSIKGSTAKFKHDRLAATTTRSCSIQDNVLCIITYMDLGGNRHTTLDKEVDRYDYDTLQSSNPQTSNFIFYSIELPY